MKYLIVFILLISQLTVAQQSLDELLSQYNTRSIPYISVEGLRALQMNDDIVILDTREPSEFSVSKIEGAVHVGFNDFSSDTISEEIADPNTPIVVYCSLGIRSEEIGEKLKKAGFYNDLTSLSDLDTNGDLKYEIDFRAIYATILSQWLNADDTSVLNNSFDKLNFI